MALPGERLLIAATPDELEVGEIFTDIPPHMSVGRWFTMEAHRRHYVTEAMDHLFTDQDVFDEAVGGGLALFRRDGKLVRARRIEQLETISKENTINPQWFALHALVKGLGHFDEADKYNDVFSPHMTYTKTFKLAQGEPVLFSSVALIGTEGRRQDHRVIASFPLGVPDGE
jgi:hypothetical protein